MLRDKTVENSPVIGRNREMMEMVREVMVREVVRRSLGSQKIYFWAQAALFLSAETFGI